MNEPRTAVVSGGATGIGQAVVSTLLAAGYSVAMLGRRAEALEEAAQFLAAESGPHRLEGYAVDLSDPTATSKSAPRIAEALGGKVDVVVANAGRPARRTGAELASHGEVWADAVLGNTMPTVNLVEAMRPWLSDTGRLIFVSSAAATGAGGGAYGGAKAALHAWMYDLALELGPRGITCNTVTPGYIDDTDLFSGRLSKERHEAFVERTLVKRAGKPDDVARCVEWLAAADSGYVTAQIIGIDGGALVDPG